MRARLREWWQARAARERTVIAAGLAAVLIAAVWAYVWVPIEADRNRLIVTVPKLRAQAQQLTRDASEVSSLRSAARARVGTAAPQRAIEEAMRAAGLGEGYSGTAGLGDGRIQVNMGVVAFDPLVRALAELAGAHGLAVETLAVRSTGEPGKVRVDTLVLKGSRNG